MSARSLDVTDVTRYVPNFTKIQPVVDFLGLPFSHEVYYGRPVRRASVAFGDRGLTYRYAGQHRNAQGWPEVLTPLKRQIEHFTGSPFNFALVNLYLDGQAGLGWHADDEPEIVPESTIASLSFGAPRLFRLRRNCDGRITTFTLEPGSLMLMENACQAHFQHEVPKTAKVKEPRVNITFRHMRCMRNG